MARAVRMHVGTVCIASPASARVKEIVLFTALASFPHASAGLRLMGGGESGGGGGRYVFDPSLWHRAVHVCGIGV